MPAVLTDRELRKAGLGHLCAKPAPDPIKKNPKYNNIKTETNGLKFDSKKEERRYNTLKAMERNGIIQDLKMQVAFVLAPKVKFSSESRTKPALRYVADFVYTRNGQQIVEDVKSIATRKSDTYRIKKHLMMSVHGIEITEV